MTKPLWARLKSTFSRGGRTPKEHASSLSNKLNVDEEYKEAFRTKSYVEMWTKVQDQLRKTRIDGVNKVTSPSSSLPFYLHLSDYLLEPQQRGTLREMIEASKFHHFLDGYFKASFEACHICGLLLQCIQQTLANNKKIRRVIKLSKRVQATADYSDEISSAMYRELAAYALLENPLSIFYTTVKFNDFHDKNLVLLHGLTSEQRRIMRKAKFRRICMKVGGGCLVISHTALLIALLVIAIHGIVGIVAAPGIMGCSLSVFRKQIMLVHRRLETSKLEKRLGAQLDLAAKGTYILINDFDTMSRLVRRLFDEVEHRKALADMCVRNKKPELLKEAVKDFHTHNLCYLEQLEELEQHIYLCFHTINRSRKLVMDEIMVAPDNSTAEDHQQKLLRG
ncbi:hypothetical protein SADUNF_Sadunf05G0185200 [Salix dunnii]|uniref:Uncharacterized protein n=1 Tax=Salix dunnii TaxID=1413687 RepID=A0A835KC13_9ROSI|nr:hypothetical protein SADUNF_Sadunf05G0185200 [Salix dunnii]